MDARHDANTQPDPMILRAGVIHGSTFVKMLPQSHWDLTQAYEEFTAPVETFHPGDLIEWKPGLKNRSTKGPFVVIEQCLDAPRIDYETKFNSYYYQEPLDLCVGVIIEEGEERIFHTMWADSRRFQKT